MKIFLRRFRDRYEQGMMREQFGFLRGRSTVDAIFITNRVLRYVDGKVFGCFIDLRAAYDHLSREAIFDVLELRCGSKTLTNILIALYAGTTAQVSGAKETFRTFSGCRQGGQESPCLFNVFLDHVLRICEHDIKEKYPNAGIKFDFGIASECYGKRGERGSGPAHGTDRLKMLLYADDIVVFARTTSELEGVLNIIYEIFYSILYSHVKFVIAETKYII